MQNLNIAFYFLTYNRPKILGEDDCPVIIETDEPLSHYLRKDGYPTKS